MIILINFLDTKLHYLRSSTAKAQTVSYRHPPEIACYLLPSFAQLIQALFYSSSIILFLHKLLCFVL